MATSVNTSETEQSRINVDVVDDLLEWEPRHADGRPVDLANPPTDDDGELICGRECHPRNPGKVCRSPVRIPFVPCDAHQVEDPIV